MAAATILNSAEAGGHFVSLPVIPARSRKKPFLRSLRLPEKQRRIPLRNGTVGAIMTP
jgi:hypothetical protein